MFGYILYTTDQAITKTYEPIQGNTSTPLFKINTFKEPTSGKTTTVLTSARPLTLNNSRISEKPGLISFNTQKENHTFLEKYWKARLLHNSEQTNDFLNSYAVSDNQIIIKENRLIDFDKAVEQEKPEAGEKAKQPKASRKKSRFNTMYFMTPTVSYRKLSGNKSFMRTGALLTNSFSYPSFYDINNAVTHKPDLGLEFGFATKYALSKSVKVKGGLQFNINRYGIKAFSTSTEVATIALNYGYRIDSVNAITNYRNFNGTKTDWLENFYFQISAPVGLEVKLHGNDKTYIGIAGTIQPTYVIGDRAYLITADYKNYAKVPWLIRRWNVNTSFETFVSYSTNHLQWQVGPQVRYQLLSSFTNKYPIKENLFDFGLKVGVSLNQH